MESNNVKEINDAGSCLVVLWNSFANWIGEVLELWPLNLWHVTHEVSSVNSINYLVFMSLHYTTKPNQGSLSTLLFELIH